MPKENTSDTTKKEGWRFAETLSNEECKNDLCQVAPDRSKMENLISLMLEVVDEGEVRNQDKNNESKHE